MLFRARAHACVAPLTTPDSFDFSHCHTARFHSGPAPWAARNAPSWLNARHTYSCGGHSLMWMHWLVVTLRPACMPSNLQWRISERTRLR